MDIFFFTRRTPRTLTIQGSSCAPMLARRAGTRKYTLQWRNMPASSVSDRAIAVIKSVATRVNGSPRIDLELAAVALLENGFDVEHVPARKNADGITRPAYIRIAA